MAMKALDIEAVQAFLLVAELKSFTRAAEAMDTTQSAVSLKIKRLEDELSRRLIDRTPRLVRLSAEGQAFLAPARQLIAAHGNALESFAARENRRLIIGISDHVVGAELPVLLKRMSASDPHLVLEVRVAASSDVLYSFERGALDAAIVLAHDRRRRDGEIIVAEKFGWMAAPEFERRPDELLRLAAQSESCSVRSMAIAALDAAGIAWTEVFVGGGILTLGAAVSAGLAVAALARRVVPPGMIDAGPKLGLPPLPSRDVMLYTNVSDARARSSLRTLAAAIRSTAGLSPAPGAARGTPRSATSRSSR
jgi:DNA-binding transcriptional LysR family regulator